MDTDKHDGTLLSRGKEGTPGLRSDRDEARGPHANEISHTDTASYHLHAKS